MKPKLIIKEITPSEITSLASVKNGTKELIYAATDLGLLRSEDAGEHWTLSVVPGSVAVSALYMSPASDGYLVAKGSGGLSASPDYGEHWAQILFPLPASDVNEVAIPVEKSSPLLIATRLGLYSSPDFGNTWYAITKGLPPSTVSSVVYSPQKGAAYALQYGQLFVSTDEGSSWSAIPATHRSLSLKQLWVPDATSARLYGITTDLGILFRN